MGQRLRVVGWLRFGNKAQLTKGLLEFSKDAAPEYYDVASWDVDGLDARIDLDAELPGDFTRVELPFMAIARSAAFGYLDYFEEGNEQINGGAARARALGHPLKRWACREIDRKLVFREGTSSLSYAGKDEKLVVAGSFTYPDEKTAVRARGALPIRLPYLAVDGSRELRLDDEAITLAGATLSVELIVRAPDVIRGPLVEVALALRQKSISGEMFVASKPGGTWAIGTKGNAKVRSSEMIDAPEAALTIATVGADAPLPARAETPKAKGPSRRTRVASDVISLEVPAPLAGAQLLRSGRLLTWGEHHVSVWDGSSGALIQTFSLTVSEDDTYGWPVRGVLELGDVRVVAFSEMNGDLDLLDLSTHARRVIRTGEYSVGRVFEHAGRLMSCSSERLRTFSLSGEPEHVLSMGDGLRAEHVLPLGDGSVVVIGQTSVRWDPRTGATLEQYGERTAVHPLAGERFLLEQYGVFELRGAPEPLSFTVDAGNAHEVHVLRDDEIVIPVAKRLYTVSLRTGETQEHRTAHTKNIGTIVRLGNGRWVSHAKSHPGLNERFGFDGTLRVLEEGSWTELDHHDAKAPIRAIVPLSAHHVAVLLDHPVRGRTIPIFDTERGQLTTTIEGPKKEVLGILPLPERRALVWAKDKTARIVATG